MSFRVTTVNRWQDHKSWGERRELIVDQLEQLRADVLALNEVCIPLQTGRYLQQAAATRLGVGYNSIQQYKVNGSSGRPQGLSIMALALTQTPIPSWSSLSQWERDRG